MALPKIATPTFDLIQPTTGDELQYRPFLVKEEKILLTARESGDRVDVFRAIKQIINNCIITEGFDVDNIPLVDMEYIFIQLRSKSVDNIIKFQVEDSDDGKTYDLQVDLNEVEVKMPEEKHDGIIRISETHGVKMIYPTAVISDHINKMNSLTEVANEMVLHCIEYVFDEENTYPWDKESRKEKEEFINSLSVDVYEKMQAFFETSPYIEHEVKYKNSQDKDKKVVFRNLDDFFILD